MHSDQIRLRRLNEILGKLSSGQSVQNRALQAWLTEEEYKNYLDRVIEQSDLRSTLKAKPLEVVKYERLLKRAVLLSLRVNRYRGKTGYDARTRALAACERALEYLAESVKGRGDLEQWFDRPVTCPPGGELGADPHSMPIPVTSKSINVRPNRGYTAMLCTKRQLKVAAVETAIETLQSNVDAPLSEDLALAVINQRRKKIKGVFDD